MLVSPRGKISRVMFLLEQSSIGLNISLGIRLEAVKKCWFPIHKKVKQVKQENDTEIQLTQEGSVASFKRNIRDKPGVLEEFPVCFI